MALSPKQQAWIEHYLTCWNATEAAKQAGYSEKSARKQGSRMSTNVDIQAAIKARLADLQMGADEVLTRITDQARGSLAPFIRRDADGDLYGFDLGETQPLHLIKKASVTRRRQKDDRDEIVTVETVTIELYDAQTALTLLGKHHGLFVERTETTIDILGDAAAALDRKLVPGDDAGAAAGVPGEPDEG